MSRLRTPRQRALRVAALSLTPLGLQLCGNSRPIAGAQGASQPARVGLAALFMLKGSNTVVEVSALKNGFLQSSPSSKLAVLVYTAAIAARACGESMGYANPAAANAAITASAVHVSCLHTAHGQSSGCDSAASTELAARTGPWCACLRRRLVLRLLLRLPQWRVAVPAPAAPSAIAGTPACDNRAGSDMASRVQRASQPMPNTSR
jgi:hypothetical protein